MELIYEDRSRIEDMKSAIYGIMDRANSILENFKEFSGRSISTHEDFLKLIGDPVRFFDQILFEVAEIKLKDKKPDPTKLAELFGIDRGAWLKIAEDSLTTDLYKRYQPYMVFNEGTFTANDEAISKAMERYKVFAKTPGQIETATHFRNLVTVLNSHLDRGHTGPATLQQIAKLLNFRFADGRLFLDNELLSNLILKIQ